jgi:ribonuclease D
MTIIKSSQELADFCKKIEDAPFLTIDTEFLRERTYYPKLCLIQVSAPDCEAIAIDPVAHPDLNLAPLTALLKAPNIIKVMHSGRQDMEIFLKLFGFLPEPFYDTQIAAMVCGYGEQVGYEAIVRSVLNIQVDKSKQYTDWSLRPLSEAQITYALNDVIYLKEVYLHLDKQLKESGRDQWVLEEMAAMLDVNLYEPPLEDLWKRIRIKTSHAHKLAILQDLAIWREEFARRKDIPRNHVMKDDTLAEIALQSPRDTKALCKIRGLSERVAEGDKGRKIVKIIQNAFARDKEDCPEKILKPLLPNHLQSTLEMLKMLLKIQAADNNVAAKLIARTDDLELIALSDDTEILALQGWRREVFGQKALDLKNGKIAFTLGEGKIKILPLDNA